MTAYFDAQVRAIEAARDRGASIKVIARELNVSPARVTQIIGIAGLSRKTKRGPEECARAQALRSSGLSLNSIARHLGVTKNTAAGIVRKAQSFSQAADAP